MAASEADVLEPRSVDQYTTGPNPGRLRSIRIRLFITFSLTFVIMLILIELIRLVGLLFTSFNGQLGQRREEALIGLELIADLKTDRLERWFDERKNDAHIFVDNDFFEFEVPRLRLIIDDLIKMGTEGDDLWNLIRKEQSYRRLADYLEDIKTTYGTYTRTFIADLETGNSIVSTDLSLEGTNITHIEQYSEAFDEPEAIGDVDMVPSHPQPTLYFSHQVMDREGQRVAILFLEVDANAIIRPMLHTGEGFGESGEALLVNQEVMILTSLKHPLADGSLAKPLEYEIQAQPAVLATSGEAGVIETDDYRGVPVLAAYQFIPVTGEWGWEMVVKQDRSELFAPFRIDLALTLSVGLIGIVALIAVTSVLANDLTRPIRSLSEVASKVADGNISARAYVNTEDEAGRLAISFNSMMDQVLRRTEELELTNEELRAAQEELPRKERLAALGQLAGGVAHELRNPLGVISNAVYFLQTNLNDADQVTKEYLEMISSDMGISERIISDLLDFSRTKTPDRKEKSIILLVSKVFERCPPPDGIEVITVIPQGIPCIVVDPQQIGKMLKTLVTNAYQAMVTPFEGKRPANPRLTIEARVKEKEILIVDDNYEFCRALGDILIARGFVVTVIMDPTRLEYLLGGLDVSVVLLDMKLNGKTGYDVLKMIREWQPNLPVILITGFPEEMTPVIEAALKIKAYACLYKPLQIEELLQVLTEVKHQRLGRELQQSLREYL